MKGVILNINSWISFLILGGTPLIMLLVFYFLGYDNSTFFVIITKLLLFGSVIFLFLKSKLNINRSQILSLFTIFWFVWFIRIFYDSNFNLPLTLMLDTSKYYLFSFFFAIVPFFYGNLFKDDNSVKSVLNGILWSNILFSTTVLLLFYSVLSDVHRLGSEDGSVNPLVISYIASMNIGYFLWRIIVSRFTWLSLILITINIPIVGLGASKGGVVALILALITVLFVVKKINKNFFLMFIGCCFIISYSSFFGLNTLVDRFLYSVEKNTSGEKELRYYLWKAAFEKFVDYPFFGYYTELKGTETYQIGGPTYPHNIVLESFMSMGIVGGGLMLIIIIITLKNAITISRRKINESWILLFFLIALYQNMFSGNIYSGAIWFWFFTGLINGRFMYLKNAGKS